MSETNNTNIIKYSLIFAGLYYPLSIGFGLLIVFLESPKSIIQPAIVVIICASLVSWHFAKRQKRHPNQTEFWKLVVYCVGWCASLETLSLILALFAPAGPKVPVGIEIVAIPNVFVVYLASLVLMFLFVWLGFGVAGKRMIEKELKKQRESVV